MVENSMITDTDWEVFFNTLFACAGSENALREITIPLAKALDDAGYIDQAMKVLKNLNVRH